MMDGHNTAMGMCQSRIPATVKEPSRVAGGTRARQSCR